MSQMGRAVKPEELHGFPFVVVQSLSHIQLLATPWIVAYQAFLSFTISWSLLRFMSIESVILSNHFILCGPLFFLSSIFPSIRVFFSMSQLFALGGQSTGASASASILPMNIQGWFPSGFTDLILQSKGLSGIVLQHHNSKAWVLQRSAFFMVQL